MSQDLLQPGGWGRGSVSGPLITRWVGGVVWRKRLGRGEGSVSGPLTTRWVGRECREKMLGGEKTFGWGGGGSVL